MNLTVALIYSLNTYKRVSRFVEVFDPQTGLAIVSELPKRLLLPRVLPQEWLPVDLRTGKSGPVQRWTDRSLFVADEEPDPEGLPSQSR